MFRGDNEEDVIKGTFTSVSGELEDTSFTDETVIPGQIYFYKVRACSVWYHFSESGQYIRDVSCNMEYDPELVDDGYTGSL